MRKFMIAAVIIVLAISSCKKDDDDSSDTDCFDCLANGVTTEYCYTDGDDHYVFTGNGTVADVPLNGVSWSDWKTALQAACE